MTTSAGAERWSVKTGYWDFGPNEHDVDGQFIERRAEFAGAGDVMNVDTAGRSFSRARRRVARATAPWRPPPHEKRLCRRRHDRRLHRLFQPLEPSLRGALHDGGLGPVGLRVLVPHKMWLSTAAGTSTPAAPVFQAERVN